MKLYREVKCSDRLPENGGFYSTDLGIIGFNINGYWTSEYRNPTWWLEPYELPTAEEIEAVLLYEYNKSEFSWIERMAKAITKLINGER